MLRLLSPLFLAFAVTACSTTPAPQGSDEIYDPFESLNRNVYGFNESVDKAIVGPAARAYNNNVPKPARNGLSNFLSNANAPVVFANDILQAKPGRAAETLSRFIINTTVGLGGLFDVAGKSDLEGHTEDFGQTLGVWGVPMGPYVMTPLLGPSNLRDTVGGVVDMAFDPLTWVEFGLSDLDLYISGGRTVAGAYVALMPINAYQPLATASCQMIYMMICQTLMISMILTTLKTSNFKYLA